jgi:acyl-CoA reductase-like NAD-dependent aldehyde dehydrogenase
LPSNSPGVHTLWLPVIPLQLGLVLKPGPQEPWTPYRMMAAFVEAGIPAEVFGMYPGEAEAGAAVLESCARAMIFGGTATVEQYKGNPRVQAHGPGFSKILLGDDVVDQWEEYIDLMAESIYINSGRGCINCSGVWASRHTKQIAQALADRLGPTEAKPPDDPEAGLAAFTIPGMAAAVWNMIEADLKENGVTDMTSTYGERLLEQERCGYLRPTIVHCASPDNEIAKKEYMFPFSSVVQCPQEEMLKKIGPTLVCSAITKDEQWIRQLSDAVHIDRLNVGAIPTSKLNWLQPHEGSIIDFLFRSRAYQLSEELMPAVT